MAVAAIASILEVLVFNRKEDTFAEPWPIERNGDGRLADRCAYTFGLYKFGQAGRQIAMLKSIFLCVSLPQIQPVFMHVYK